MVIQHDSMCPDMDWWQEYKRLELQYNLLVNGQKQAELREAVQQLLRWAWKRNKNLEEQAAQLHMLVGWSQLVEVGTPFCLFHTIFWMQFFFFGLCGYCVFALNFLN